jgi:homospermidine synthase
MFPFGAKESSKMSQWPVYGKISGPIVLIGFGSIGRGILPLIERHFDYDKSRFTIIDPVDDWRHLADERGIAFMKIALTESNFREVLTPLLTTGQGQAFIVNLSVDVCSLDIIKLARELNALYVDTVVEPWPGFYFDPKIDNEARTNYALRETVLEERRKNPGGSTAVSCCGANPGMVSWFAKQALVNIARDTGVLDKEPTTKDEWAKLAQKLGVKGVHIAERDTQRAKTPKPRGVFVNTWSVEGFVSEGMQPAELGWERMKSRFPILRARILRAAARRSI